MSIPKAFMDEIRARVPLSDVIGKRTKLTRAGREHKGCCPFHKEKTPSFTVNDQKGFYHCFGCGAHGDVIGFVMNHDNLPFMQAVEQLAALAGLQVPQPTPQEQKQFQRQMSMYDLMEEVAQWYADQLHGKHHKKILEYLIERDLSLETIRGFRLGFATDDSSLIDHLKKKGYDIDSIMELGLYRESERQKGSVYPFFRNRVMFPVMDLQGRVVAFGGRILPERYGGPAGKSAPKYVNSPESPIFHKGRLLYGLSRARKVVGDGEPVVVVEGYMDVIALAQGGFKAAVAPLGTALTETQIEELWRVMPEGKRAPVLCFDGDVAGQRAATRSLDRILPILKPDYSVKFAFLPAEHDPDTLIKAEGARAMQKVMDNAIGIFDMMWNEEAKNRNFSQPETKAGFRFALEKSARRIANMTVQEFFIHEINQKIKDVFLSNKSSSGTAKKAYTPYVGGRRQQVPAGQMPYRPVNIQAKPIRAGSLLREKVLIAAVINYPELFEHFAEEFGMISIPDHDYDQMRQEMIRFLGAAHRDDKNAEIPLDDQVVKQHLIDSGYAQILETLFDKSLYVHAGFAKPEQPFDIVRQGWQDTYNRGVEQSRWKKAD